MINPIELYVDATILAETQFEIGGAEASDIADNLGTTFSLLQTVFRIVAIAILIIVVWRIAKAFAAGKTADVVKTAAFGLIGAILCWDISLPISLIGSLGDVATNLFSEAGTTIEDATTK